MPDAITKALKLKGLAKRYGSLLKETGLSGSPQQHQSQSSDLPLQDFIPEISPNLKSPYHLAPVTDVFERVEVEPVRALVSTPPQHGKTETVKHAIAWLLARNPAMRIAYVSYVQSFADKQSSYVRRYLQAAGVPIDKSYDTRRFIKTEAGGYFVATSVGGELTGLGFDVIIVDDPFKDRRQADSLTTRDAVYDWYSSVALTRLSPGASVVVVHTRWHEDDLIGRLKQQKREDGSAEWECIRLPAVNDFGEPLWPERYSLTTLEKRRRANEFDWWSLYQGEPRPRGGQLFREPLRYEGEPSTHNKRVVIACDPAASSKTHADFSAIVVLACEGYEEHMRADVIEVIRVQKEIPELCKILMEIQQKHAAELHIESIGLGKAVPQMLRSINPNLLIREITQADGAIGDKFTRAQPVASAWNSGRVRVPKQASWLLDFLQEVQVFTGVGDAHDDQVDALAYAWNAGAKTVSFGVGVSPLHDDGMTPEERALEEYIQRRLESLNS